MAGEDAGEPEATVCDTGRAGGDAVKHPKSIINEHRAALEESATTLEELFVGLVETNNRRHHPDVEWMVARIAACAALLRSLLAVAKQEFVA